MDPNTAAYIITRNIVGFHVIVHSLFATLLTVSKNQNDHGNRPQQDLLRHFLIRQPEGEKGRAGEAAEEEKG